MSYEQPGGPDPEQQPEGPGVWAAPSDPKTPGTAPLPPQQPPYGPPPTGQQPWGPPPTGQPWGTPPAGQQPWGTPPAGQQPWGLGAPAPRRSRKPWFIGCGILAVVVLAGGGAAAYAAYQSVSDAPTAHRLVPPTTFQGLSRTGNEAAEQKMSSASLAAGGDALKKNPPVSALYSDSSGARRFIVSGNNAKALFTATEVNTPFDHAPANETVGTRKSYDPGPLGGKLVCAPVTIQQVPFGQCVWGDNGTVAVILETNGSDSIDLDEVAADTRAYRAVAEVDK